MKRNSVLLLAAGFSLAIASEAQSQQLTQRQSTGSRSSTTSNGTFGTTTRGGTLGNANRSFARGGTQGGQGQMGDVSGTGAGQLNGNERFTRQGRQGNSFVGRDTQDMQNFVGALTAAQQGGRGQQNMFGGRGAMGGRGQNGQMDDFIENNAADQLQNQRRFRTKLSLGFQPAPRLVQAANVEFTARVSKTMERALGPAVAVSLQEGLVVLSGTVPTAEEKMLAEQLALLEPGISQVQNDLVVAGSTTPR